jgi:hypothetical protein
MHLNYWRNFWVLDPVGCPCDIHLVEYLAEAGIRGQTVFHFGTGHHHLVGTRNLELAPPNEILGITASREEHDTYVHLILKNPRAALHYKVLFADIYTLSPALLPTFDVVTLFHLCEYYAEATRAYTATDDRAVLRMFVGALRPGGLLLLYNRSQAYRAARALAEEAVRAGDLAKLNDYKTLEVFRKSG